MTKHIGYEPGDFHFEDQHRQTGIAHKVLPRLLDFMLPVVIAVLALYIGRHGFG